MNHTVDLPDPPGRWQRIKDLPPSDPGPRSSSSDFAADAGVEPDPGPRRSRVAGKRSEGASRPDLDDVRTRAAELLARRDGISFAQAARLVPSEPEKLKRLVKELKRTKPEKQR